MLYLFWLIHIVCGALTDSRMWNDKNKDPEWVKEYTDIFWLAYFGLCPFWIAYVGSDILTIKSVLIAFGMSVVWDLIFSKIEYGKWVVALPYWLILPNPFEKKNWYEKRIVIGFTETQMYIFNTVRIAGLITTVFL